MMTGLTGGSNVKSSICYFSHSLHLASAPARSSIVEIRSPPGKVAERPGDAVAIGGLVIRRQADCNFLSSRGEIVQVAVVSRLTKAGRGPLATSFARIELRVADSLCAIFGICRVCCHGARLVLRRRVVPDRSSVKVEPPFAPSKFVFQINLVLRSALDAVMRKARTQRHTVAGLHERRAGQVIATGVVVTIRCPINKQRSFLDVVQRRVNLPP